MSCVAQRAMRGGKCHGCLRRTMRATAPLTSRPMRPDDEGLRERHSQQRATGMKTKESAVKDQLEALVNQMHKSGILYSEAVREFKKRFLVHVLQENNGNRCKAARELGMHRNTLSRTIAELKLDVRSLRNGARRPPRAAKPQMVERKVAR